MLRVPTTFELDGLLSDEDIKNKNTVVYQCRSCKKWTTHYNHISGERSQFIPCFHCGLIDYDHSSIKSIRTYNQFNDNKRKTK